MKTKKLDFSFINSTTRSAQARHYLRGLLFLAGVFMMTSCLQSERIQESSTATNECLNNSATTSECTVSTIGSYVTSYAGNNITGGTYNSTLRGITAQVLNGFYLNKVVLFTDNNFEASNIKGGVTAFGLTGTYSPLASMAHRSTGTAQLTMYGETSLTSYLPYSDGTYSYRQVPKVSEDDDGTGSVDLASGITGHVSYVDRSGWDNRTCGVSQATIDLRIADCAREFQNATWKGSDKGNSGEATWKLVTRMGECTSPIAPNVDGCGEVWRDERTGLLWSSRVVSSINWCRAAGSNYSNGGDSAGFCAAANSQQEGDTTTTSVCSDIGLNGAAVSTTYKEHNAKGKLRNDSAPKVYWRLPTYSDWQIANVDGIRFVMPDMGKNSTGTQGEWSATIKSTSALRSHAWVFDFYEGGYSTKTRGDSLAGVRCVGH